MMHRRGRCFGFTVFCMRAMVASAVEKAMRRSAKVSVFVGMRNCERRRWGQRDGGAAKRVEVARSSRPGGGLAMGLNPFDQSIAACPFNSLVVAPADVAVR